MKVSYLSARDPSIITFSGRLPREELNYQNELENIDESEVSNDRITVYLRLKKTDELCENYKFAGNRVYCDNQIKQNTYEFSHIFDASTTQVEIFNYIAKPNIVDFIEANNFTLLTYGCSGSGKTYTLIGTETQPGIIPRYLSYLFKSLGNVSTSANWKPMPSGAVRDLSDAESRFEMTKHEKLVGNTDIIANKSVYTEMFGRMERTLDEEPVAIVDNSDAVVTEVWISFLEIYNENIYDLLSDDLRNCKNRQSLKVASCNNRSYVKGLSSVHVTSSSAAFELLQYGLNYLNYACTAMNDHSSRSHCMYTIKLVQTKPGYEPIVSSFNFCDLAGSERMKNTHNVGIRLKESNNINTSLFTLQKCIKMIRDAQTREKKVLVPYRESKLTQLLQGALVDGENISMIVNFNPSTTMYAQSQVVLRFAAISQQITFDDNNCADSRPGSSSSLAGPSQALLQELHEKRALAEEVQKQLEEKRQAIRAEEAQKRAEELRDLRQKWESELKEEEEAIAALEEERNEAGARVDRKTSYRDKLRKMLLDRSKKLIC